MISTKLRLASRRLLASVNHSTSWKTFSCEFGKYEGRRAPFTLQHAITCNWFWTMKFVEFKDGVPSSGRWAAMPVWRITDTNLLPGPFSFILLWFRMQVALISQNSVGRCEVPDESWQLQISQLVFLWGRAGQVRSCCEVRNFWVETFLWDSLSVTSLY